MILLEIIPKYLSFHFGLLNFNECKNWFHLDIVVMTNVLASRKKQNLSLDLTMTLPDAKQTTNDVNNLYSQDRTQKNYFRSEMTQDLFFPLSSSLKRLLILCNAIIWLLHIFLCDSKWMEKCWRRLRAKSGRASVKMEKILSRWMAENSKKSE